MSESEKLRLNKKLLEYQEKKINLMITGCTGCGKSSTINALFDMERDPAFAKQELAKIGTGVDPETMKISRYELGNLILWDSPGLGDGKDRDAQHRRNIINKLNEKDDKGDLLIDLVLVIVDGSNRDMGTSYELINNVIIPELGKNAEKRILVGINKADAAKSGRDWDYENHRPLPSLEKFLNEKAESVKKRIHEATGVEIEPICYSAGYKEEGEPQEPSYNLAKLLTYIIRYTPKEKRLGYVDNINSNAENFRSNSSDYTGSSEVTLTGKTFTETIEDFTRDQDTVFGKIVSGAVGAACSELDYALGIATRTISNISDGCYITTAVCEELGKPDDCYELTQFRHFRDDWLSFQPDGKELIKLYYKTAPRIVQKIDSRPEKHEIYAYLRDTFLSKCLGFIESGKNEKCKHIYTNMMYYLFEEEKKW